MCQSIDNLWNTFFYRIMCGRSVTNCVQQNTFEENHSREVGLSLIFPNRESVLFVINLLIYLLVDHKLLKNILFCVVPI